MKLILFILTFFSAQAFGATEFHFLKEKGSVHFSALGNPSAIRIEGKGVGPEGVLKTEEKGENLIFQGDLIVPLNTLDTGIALRDRHMKEKYLEVEKHETAVLKINLSTPKSAFKKTLETKGDFSGVLEFHGVQKPISGIYNFKLEGKNIATVASFQIKLSDYGVAVPSFAGITVADVVELSVKSLIESPADLVSEGAR